MALLSEFKEHAKATAEKLRLKENDILLGQVSGSVEGVIDRTAAAFRNILLGQLSGSVDRAIL